MSHRLGQNEEQVELHRAGCCLKEGRVRNAIRALPAFGLKVPAQHKNSFKNLRQCFAGVAGEPRAWSLESGVHTKVPP